MKLKTISLLLSIVMMIGLISCDTKEADGTQGTSNNVAESSAEDSSLSDVDDTSLSTDADSSEATDVSDTKTSEKTESNTETISETSTETVTETETIAEEDNDFMEYVDFLVSVPEDRDPVILQLTDTQIIDPGQARTPLAASAEEYWAIEKRDQLCYDFIRETVEKTEPDLIIITGDLIYGAYDDNGSVLLDFIRFMESFDIPWAPVFGNHDNQVGEEKVKMAAEILKTVLIRELDELLVLGAVILLRALLSILIHFEMKHNECKISNESINN